MLEDRVELPRLYLAWPSPPLFSSGDAELDLAADVLANGRTSRLYRRLIYDQRIATDVAAAQTSRELGGMFQLLATAAPGRSLAELHDVMCEEITRLAGSGPDQDELERGHAQTEAAFVYRVQSLGGFGGKADQLNAYNVHLGEPDSFARDRQRYLAATSASVQSAVRTWLEPARAAALSIVPAGQAGLALPDSMPASGK